MKPRLLLASLALVGFLVGCGNREGRGGLTADEERQLDNAAAMLEDNSIDVSPDSLTTNEQQLQAMDEEPAPAENAAANSE